jgi:hypothetical protein
VFNSLRRKVMNSNRNSRLVKFAVLALLIGAFAPQALRADEECSNRTLKGTYRAMGGGTIVGVGPIAVVNGVVLDGSGNGQTFGVTQSVNGNIVTPPPGPVTYTVNADCTGTATFPAGDFNIVVDKKGAGWFYISTKPVNVVSGYTIRLAEDSDYVCSNSTLQGNFRAIGSGTVGIVPPGEGVPKAVVNNLYLDGNGNGQVTMSTQATNGIITTGTATVTYTVNADCTGTASFSGAPFNWVVDSKGAGFFYISTKPGNVVTGRVERLDEDHEGEDHQGEEK